MNPKKAIKILSIKNKRRYVYPLSEWKEARQLGVEALERHQENQAKLAFPEMHLLPSETAE